MTASSILIGGGVGVVIALGAPSARADADAAAAALFQQGIADLQAGNTEKACSELKGSLDQVPDRGTEGALAKCYGQLGKIASAWTLWRELADTDSQTHPEPALRADAAANAAALEPRLPRFVIHLAGGAQAGLVVKVNDITVNPALTVPLPADPGSFAASATAPGYRTWSQSFAAREGAVTTIEIPVLAPLDAPHPPSTLPTPLQPPQDVPPPTSHTRRWVGIGLAAGGAVTLGVGVALALQGRSQYSDSGCNSDGGCHDMTELTAAQTADSRTNLGVGVALAGVVVAGTGLALWLTDHAPAESPRSAHLIIAPQLNGALAALGGTF